MSCEKTILATTAPAFPEFIEHGKTGWLVPPADAPALAEAIRMLLENPDLRKRLGKAGRQSIIERFNWRRNAEEVVQVYEQAIAKRRMSDAR